MHVGGQGGAHFTDAAPPWVFGRAAHGCMCKVDAKAGAAASRAALDAAGSRACERNLRATLRERRKPSIQHACAKHGGAHLAARHARCATLLHTPRAAERERDIVRRCSAREAATTATKYGRCWPTRVITGLALSCRQLSPSQSQRRMHRPRKRPLPPHPRKPRFQNPHPRPHPRRCHCQRWDHRRQLLRH